MAVGTDVIGMGIADATDSFDTLLMLLLVI